jgi:hypothetical protein
MTPLRVRSALLGLTLVMLFMACFGDPQTLGLPCTEHSACFDGLVCGPSGVCAEPSTVGDGDGDESTDDGDGDTGDGDTGDGDGDGNTGDGDGDPGDGDGDTGDGDGDTGDGDTGDGDGDTGEPVCGNGIREGNEVCDGMDLDDMTCADHGFGGGMLMCDDSCNLDMTPCCYTTGEPCNIVMPDCCNGQCNINVCN